MIVHLDLLPILIYPAHLAKHSYSQKNIFPQASPFSVVCYEKYFLMLTFNQMNKSVCLQIELHAQRNEILDQSSLIMRYQAEIAALRRQLEEAAQGKGVAFVDPLHPEVRSSLLTDVQSLCTEPIQPDLPSSRVKSALQSLFMQFFLEEGLRLYFKIAFCPTLRSTNVYVMGQRRFDGRDVQVRNLRERLEEEHQALLQREQDKVTLEVRIARLTRIILHSTRVARPVHTYGHRYRQLLLSESQVCHASRHLSLYTSLLL